MTLTPKHRLMWASRILQDCLSECGDDVDSGLVAADYILATQPFPDEVEIEQNEVDDDGNPPIPVDAALAVQHAPEGGVIIGGRRFEGGEFIPDEAWEKATPEEAADHSHKVMIGVAKKIIELESERNKHVGRKGDRKKYKEIQAVIDGMSRELRSIAGGDLKKVLAAYAAAKGQSAPAPTNIPTTPDAARPIAPPVVQPAAHAPPSTNEDTGQFPVAVYGQPLPRSKVDDRADEIDNLIRGKLINEDKFKRERAYGLTDAGTEWNAIGGIGTKGIKGAAHVVVTTSSQMEKIRGGIFTHTHPSGSSFSASDVGAAQKYNLKEIRAVTKDGTFILGPPPGGWKSVNTDLEQEWGRSTGYANENIARLAKKYGLYYTFKPVNEKPLSVNALFAHDIYNRQAQGILNRSLQVAKGLSAAAKKDLVKALKRGATDSGEAILAFINKYRVALAKLLSTTQLASLLEGAREIAVKIPTLAPFPGAVAPPPTLEPQEAVKLVNRISALTGEARAKAVYALPTEQQAYVSQAIAVKEASPPIRPPTFIPPAPAVGEPDGIHFPTIEEAVKRLAEKNVLTRPRFDALDAAARAKAFTVAGVQAEETLTKIRDSLSRNIQEGADYETWQQKVLEDVDQGTFMSEGHLCFLPETVIEGAVTAASKIWYSGPIAEIETNDGRRLRVTIHHPILTTFGWKYAGSLQQGEYLICYGDPIKSLRSGPSVGRFTNTRKLSHRRTIDDYYIPTSVKNIFEALFVKRPSNFRCTFPVTSLDFYGDGIFTQGQVYCVRPYGRSRAVYDKSYSSKTLFQRRFVHRGIPAPNSSSSNRLSLFGALLNTSSASGNSGVSIPHSGFTGFLSTPLADVYLPYSKLLFGTASYMDPNRFHTMSKSPGSDVQLASELPERFPSKITTNRIRSVKIVRFSGHVYDLQTATGWIVSQGIVSGNSTVFRTNVQGAFSDGQMTVLNHPLVRSGFPYSAYDAIHDDRVRDNHLALESLGIGGTNIYRTDDPVFQLFRPPWDYMDRCSWTAMTVRQAAEAGIAEAVKWLKSGVEPTPPAYVPMPPFQPPPGFQRAISQAPLSIQLSMQSLSVYLSTSKPEEETETTLLFDSPWGAITEGALDTATTRIDRRAKDKGKTGRAKGKGGKKAGRGSNKHRSLFRRMRIKKKWRPTSALSVDAQGLEHRDKGPGGGQFTKSPTLDRYLPVLRGYASGDTPNRQLRENSRKLTKKQRDQVKMLDAAIKEGRPLNSNEVVYRFIPDTIPIIVGSEIIDKAYMSGTTSQEYLDRNKGLSNTVLSITGNALVADVPDIPSITGAAHQVLFARNTRLRIVGEETIDGVRFVDAVIVDKPKSVSLSVDAHGAAHDKAGRFTSKGGSDTDIAELRSSRRGRRILAKGRRIAAKVKDSVSNGVRAALDGLDAEMRGGVSIIAGGLDSKDPKVVAAGVAQCLNSVFYCVHEEVWEYALAEHNFPGTHAAGMVAANLAVRTQDALVKSVVWAWGKLKPTDIRMSHDDSQSALTDGDKRLVSTLADVAKRGVQELLTAVGYSGAEIDKEKVEKRLLDIMRSGPSLSIDVEGHTHKGKGPGGGQFTAKEYADGGSESGRTKPKAARGEMLTARREGKGKEARIVLADGSAAPAHIKASMVPPQWTDVKISIDPNADVLVQAKDKKGNAKTVYSDNWNMKAQAAKFARIHDALHEMPSMSQQVQQDRQDPKKSGVADCTWLMQEQGTRPGSEADNKGVSDLFGHKLDTKDITIGEMDKKGVPKVSLKINDKDVPIKDKKARVEIARRVKAGEPLYDSTFWLKSHGATTLEGRHIVKTKDGVRLRFMGKESVWHDHLVRNPDLAAMLLSRKKAAGENGKLFGVSDGQVSAYARTLDHGGFSPKDWRTAKATRMAIEEINQTESPKDEEDYKTKVMSIAKRVSSVLGNEPAQALESYISPTVFSGWRAAIA